MHDEPALEEMSAFTTLSHMRNSRKQSSCRLAGAEISSQVKGTIVQYDGRRDLVEVIRESPPTGRHSNPAELVSNRPTICSPLRSYGRSIVEGCAQLSGATSSLSPPLSTSRTQVHPENNLRGVDVDHDSSLFGTPHEGPTPTSVAMEPSNAASNGSPCSRFEKHIHQNHPIVDIRTPRFGPRAQSTLRRRAIREASANARARERQDKKNVVPKNHTGKKSRKLQTVISTATMRVARDLHSRSLEALEIACSPGNLALQQAASIITGMSQLARKTNEILPLHSSFAKSSMEGIATALSTSILPLHHGAHAASHVHATNLATMKGTVQPLLAAFQQQGPVVKQCAESLQPGLVHFKAGMEQAVEAMTLVKHLRFPRPTARFKSGRQHQAPIMAKHYTMAPMYSTHSAGGSESAFCMNAETELCDDHPLVCDHTEGSAGVFPPGSLEYIYRFPLHC